MTGDIQREADELLRYYTELGRRLVQTGVRDIPDLVALSEQLRRSLDALTKQEIQWALDQSQRLIETLVRMDSELRSLHGLKAALERMDGATSP